MDELIYNFNKKYPNKIIKNSENSDTVKRMSEINTRMKANKGIAFYCGKRNQYIFIPSNK